MPSLPPESSIVPSGLIARPIDRPDGLCIVGAIEVPGVDVEQGDVVRCARHGDHVTGHAELEVEHRAATTRQRLADGLHRCGVPDHRRASVIRGGEQSRIGRERQRTHPRPAQRIDVVGHCIEISDEARPNAGVQVVHVERRRTRVGDVSDRDHPVVRADRDDRGSRRGEPVRHAECGHIEHHDLGDTETEIEVRHHQQ